MIATEVTEVGIGGEHGFPFFNGGGGCGQLGRSSGLRGEVFFHCGDLVFLVWFSVWKLIGILSGLN